MNMVPINQIKFDRSCRYLRFITKSLLMAGFFIAIGCSSKPVYKTFVTLTPPNTPDGKICVLQCKNIQLMCGNACDLDQASCVREVKAEARSDYREAREEYERKYREWENSPPQSRSYYAPQAPNLEGYINNYMRNADCNKNCNCEGEYYGCFELCGGIVKRDVLCVENCEQAGE